METTVKLTVNGQEKTVTTDPQRSLLDVLREDLGLTGAKYACGEGRCGACTVLVDGKSCRSCVTPVSQVGQEDDRHHRRAGKRRCAASRSGSIPRGGRHAMRLLHRRDDSDGGCIARKERRSHGPRDRRRDEREHLPVQRLSEDRQCGSSGRGQDEGIGAHDQESLDENVRGGTIRAVG